MTALLLAALAAAPCPEGMVLLRGGSFTLGQRGDRVRVRDFCLDRTPVTVAAWAACAAAGRCPPAPTAVDWPGIKEAERREASALCNGDRPDRADHPVNCVDWHQADGYCRARGRRLPREEEHEWAARGGRAGTRYPWGEEPPAGRICWNGDQGRPDDRRGTCPVGSHPRGHSPQGVADLSGNVWQWTGSANRGGADRVRRGGGWFYAGPEVVSAAYRSWNGPSMRTNGLGFRCATEPGGARRGVGR